jgi:hypothetical protein
VYYVGCIVLNISEDKPSKYTVKYNILGCHPVFWIGVTTISMETATSFFRRKFYFENEGNIFFPKVGNHLGQHGI